MAVTRPRGTMLRALSTFDGQIATNADIALSKLNRGTDLVLRDDTGPTQGSINMDGKAIYNLADGVNQTDGVTMRQLQNAIAGTGTAAEWQESALDLLSTPPTTPSIGDRYLIGSSATDAWVGKDNQIAEFNGSGWDYTVPTTGTYISVDVITDGLFYFGGTTWVKKNYETLIFAKGLYKDSGTNTVGLDDSVAGNGLAISAQGILSIEENDGIEVSADGVGVKLDGATLSKSTNGLKVNFSTALQEDGEGKLAVNIDPSGGLSVDGVTGGLKANISNGLELSSNQLQVKAKDSTIAVESEGIRVNMGYGLAADGTSGALTIQIDPDSSAGLSLGAAGLKLTIPIDVITESRYVTREPASGTVDGTNDTFYVANEPSPGSEMIFLEGSLMSPVDDYVFDYPNKKFVFVAEQIPQVFNGVPDKILISYLKKVV